MGLTQYLVRSLVFSPYFDPFAVIFSLELESIVKRSSPPSLQANELWSTASGGFYLKEGRHPEMTTKIELSALNYT